MAASEILSKYNHAIASGDRGRADRMLKLYDKHRLTCGHCRDQASKGWPA